MISASLLPYADFLVDIFIDTKKTPFPRFQNLSYGIWAYATPISCLLVLGIAKKLNPPKWAYIPTMYVNLSQVFAYIYLQANINIKSDWLFRIINFFLTIIIFLLVRKAFNRYHEDSHKDELMEEFIQSRKEYEQQDKRI